MCTPARVHIILVPRNINKTAPNAPLKNNDGAERESGGEGKHCWFCRSNESALRPLRFAKVRIFPAAPAGRGERSSGRAPLRAAPVQMEARTFFCVLDCSRIVGGSGDSEAELFVDVGDDGDDGSAAVSG